MNAAAWNSRLQALWPLSACGRAKTQMLPHLENEGQAGGVGVWDGGAHITVTRLYTLV